jgi:FkbM family methyltransferase
VIGAHIGTHLLHVNDLVGPHGKIFCYEPHPTTFEILKANIRLNNMRNIELSNKAIYNKIGKMGFAKEYPNPGGSFVVPENYEDPYKFKQIIVELSTLDKELMDISEIDVL